MFHRYSLREERGDMVLGHIITLGVIFAVVIFLVVEIGPLIWTRISIMQEAGDMADGVALSYRMSSNETAAVARGAEMMVNMGYSDQEIVDSRVVFLPAQAGKKTDIQVTLVKYYENLITRISWFKRFGKITCTKTVNITSVKQK